VVICCWSAKGGQGTSVVALALASVLARRRSSTGAVLVDLGGDAPAIAGLPDEPARVGVAEWLREGGDLPADALARLETPLAPGLSLVPRGCGPLLPDRAHDLVSTLASDHRDVVFDAGLVTDDSTAAIVVSSADDSLLVLRACYLAIKRANRAPVRPSGIVLLVEEGRSLAARDIESALGAPVRAQVPVSASVARLIDSGTFVRRFPRALERELRRAA
jgi:Flp pilus assembly CpaE family ATPase